MDAHRWLTREEAADYLRVSARQIDRWRQSGQLRSQKKGRRRYFQIEDLDSFVLDGGGDDPPERPRGEPVAYRELTYADLAELRVPVFGTPVEPVAEVDIAPKIYPGTWSKPPPPEVEAEDFPRLKRSEG